MSDLIGKFTPNTLGAHITTSSLGRFQPEPRSSLGVTFANTASQLLSAGTSALSGAASSLVGIDPKYSELIMLQIQKQEEMQQVSMISNVEKSEHEAKMAAVRNVRAG